MKEKVLQVQVHKHTDTCTKKGKLKECRFGFPKYPNDKTLIAMPVEDNEKLKGMNEEERKKTLEKYRKILEKVKEALQDENLDETMSLEKFLDKLNIGFTDYKNALGTSERGKILVLERTLKERNVNNYNCEWLRAWVSRF